MNITFDEVGHTYTDQHGNIIPSVTQILGKVYGTGLEDAPSFFVERAANKGTAIHKEIDTYLKTGKQGETPEFKAFWKWFSFGGSGKWESEKIIYATTPYGSFAGTADFLDTFLRDWKTCKTATKKQIKKWQMQLSFYYYALIRMGYALNLPLKIMHLTDTLEVINVEYLGDKFVEETMEMYSKGEAVIDVSTPKELQTVSENELLVLQATIMQIEALEQRAQEIREKIKDEMERRGILDVRVGDVKITYVSGTVRRSFDSKTFKAEHEDLYKQYQKDVEVKPSVRITIQEDK